MPEDDPQETNAGAGPGGEYAKLTAHVLPAGLFLILVTIFLGWQLHGRWPVCSYERQCGAGAAKGPANSAQAHANSGAAASETLEVTGIRPPTGSICGSTPVTLTGTGFGADAKVTFGGVSATDIKVEGGGSSLTAMTPGHWEGPVDVRVDSDAGGTRSMKIPNGFTYVCPDKDDSLLFLLVLLAGALGASLHALRSLFWFVGSRNLRVSWLWMYYVLPFTGAVTAAIFYLIIAAGLFTPESAGLHNYFLVVGIAALVGMFGPQAGEKLKKLAEAILTEARPSSDRTPKTPTIKSLKPAVGETPGGTEVTITGTDFAPGATVTFGGLPGTGVTVPTGTTILVTTPPHPAGKVDVVVSQPGIEPVTRKDGFEFQDKPAVPEPPKVPGQGEHADPTEPAPPEAAPVGEVEQQEPPPVQS